MSIEITCVLRDGRSSDEEIDGVGGPGWTQDLPTVIGELDEGRRYYVRVGAAQVNVVLIERDGRPQLRTDPAATPVNHLLALPRCA
jgi:hypothetical protein